MRILITGFGPFGRIADNPSARLAELSGHDFELIDVAYDSVDTLLAGLDPERFDVLLLIGVDSQGEVLKPELHARNWCGKKPDVKGLCPVGPIEEGSPFILNSTLWSDDLLSTVEVDPDLQPSRDAGDYLCNYVYYRALQYFPQKRVGFLHIPPFEKVPREQQVEVLGRILKQIKDSVAVSGIQPDQNGEQVDLSQPSLTTNCIEN